MRRDNSHRNHYKTYWCRTLQRWPDVQKAHRRVAPTTRRTLAALAVAAIVIGGVKIASDHTLPGSGFSTVQTAAADPTGGPTGSPGGPGGMNGSQFSPPAQPPSMPDYQGGINQPPLDQNSGISIYNSGNPQAPQQVPGQQAGQQPQQAQQPAHGTQIPDYQTATPFTQGPGRPNPDYQGPQQNSPQQGQQPQQPQQQQPSQAPTQTQQPEQPQNKQDDTTRQMDQRQQKCQAALTKLGYTAAATAPSVIGGGGRTPIWFDPRLDPIPAPDPGGCTSGCDEPQTSQSDSQRLDQLEKQMRELQEQRNQDKENYDKNLKKLQDQNRQLTCKQSGDFSACPELKRKPVPDHCEGTASNPWPMCYLNPFDTPYCSMPEAAWIAYKAWMAMPFKLTIMLPKGIEEYVNGTSEYVKKCQDGNP